MARTARLRNLVILGATGSIGRQALDVATRLARPVVALAAGSASGEFMALGRHHADARLAVAAADDSERRRFADIFGSRIDFGPEAVSDLASHGDATVVNGIVGAAGLQSSVRALLAGNRLALANKESMVVAGAVVRAAQSAGGGEIIPVDSEHSAVFQCLAGEDRSSVRRIILTASGGPFRGRPASDLDSVTVAEALDHPTWSMGKRITIDSATLMNKGFEVIEAHYLFDVDYDAIDVTVHPQSVVHSMVEFNDGTVKADLGHADMRIPIQNAITHPERLPAPDVSFDFSELTLSFEPPDVATFRCLGLAYAAGRAGGSAPAVLNAADEVAVSAFLDGRIGFQDIADVIEATLEHHDVRDIGDVADALAIDEDGRRIARDIVEGLSP